MYVIKAFYNFNNFVNNWQINKNKNIIKIEEYRFYETNKDDIFKKYIGYAVFHAIKFKKTYKINIKNNEELYMYSKMGLYKAIMNYDFNYNYKTNFLLYVKKYIYAELYNYMCDTKTLTLLPKYIRKYKKYNITKNDKNNKIYLFIDNNSNNCENREKNINNTNEIWQLIYENLDPISFRIFKYKYDYDFNVIRSNIDISKMLGTNEEYIRLRINKSKNTIKNLFMT